MPELVRRHWDVLDPGGELDALDNLASTRGAERFPAHAVQFAEEAQVFDLILGKVVVPLKELETRLLSLPGDSLKARPA